MAEGEGSVRDRVVELLNQAAFLPSEKERIATLGQVQELVVHRETDLLDTFYEEIVAFQTDKNSDVRKWIVGFIEEACKKDVRMLPLLLPNIQLLLEDPAVSVVKRCVQASAPLHKCTLVWVADAHTVTPDMELAWIILTGIKAKIVAMIDHDNDGVRTQVIKCLEAMVLVQTYSEQSSVSRDKSPTFCLDNVPLTLKLARPRKLEEEAKQLVNKLVVFQGSIHISSVNLMTCMSSLAILARARPIFIATVVQALELLHANLPPTLSKSQVNSVRKHLKLQMINLLKHPAAGEFHDSIVAVLTDLGMSNSEINKAVPNREEMRRLAKKRERAKISASKKEEKENEAARKRARLHSSTTSTSSSSTSSTSSAPSSAATSTAASTMNTSQASALLSAANSKNLAATTTTTSSGFRAIRSAAAELASTMSSIKKIKSEVEVGGASTSSSSGKGEELKQAEEEEEVDEDEAGGTVIDVTARWVVQRLNIERVTELVMTSMLSLPPTMPPLFSAGYTPVAGAGTIQQKAQLARLLAAQLVAGSEMPAGTGTSAPAAGVAALPAAGTEEDEVLQRLTGDSDDEGPLVSFMGSRSQYTVPPPALPAAVLAPIRHKIQAVKLAEVTPVLSSQQQSSLQLILARRLLNSCHLPTVNKLERQYRELMIANMLTMASDDEIRAAETVIFEDLGKYWSLIELWLFSLHASNNDFSQLSRVTGGGALSQLAPSARTGRGRSDYQSYGAVLLRVVKAALPQCHLTEARDRLSSLLLSCPSLPLEVVTVVVESGVGYGGHEGGSVDLITVVAPLLRDVALWRTSVALHTVTMLCSLATHELESVRDSVLSEIEAILLSGGSLADTIVQAGKTQLQHLVEPQPPFVLFADYLGRPSELKEWDEPTVRACLHLPLAILPLHQALIHDLANVYVKTVNEAKRGILRLLEEPVSLMGMDSPQLLSLVHSTPKGSETLITRIIHILTEKAPPSEALVCQVRELYNRRVSDVRFLIPVLTGLSKKEVIAVLHKLIKLNPHVVKEVFNRLWGVTLDTGSSPLSPVELLVALHLIEADKCDVKTVIKATGLCFQERNIYTAEVLGVVLQELLEEPTIPTLLMRTVIMALTHHPSLLSFIITVLVRLIDKQVWDFPKVWEGFIKCCERASPQSVAVLLQLPHQHLSSALQGSSVLKDTLTKHIESLTKHQRSHISHELLEIVGLTGSSGEQQGDGAQLAPVREMTSPIEHAA